MSYTSTNIVLRNLPLRPSTLSILTRHGFTILRDVESSKRGDSGGIANFATELGLGSDSVHIQEAAAIVREIESAVQLVTTSNIDRHSSNSVSNHKSNEIARPSTTRTAADILSSHLEFKRPIVSFCQSIDSLLGGGFAVSEVTELVGLPGVGKTQLCIQLCVDVALPKQFGGVCGEALYIDTEGSFVPERALDMADALVNHVTKSSQSSSNRSAGKPGRIIPERFNEENILDGIHVFRVHDEASLVATIQSLPGFIRSRENRSDDITGVKLVVVDSIAFHYRSIGPNTNYKARTQSLMKIAAFLSDLATTFDLAVVVVNQMTTKIDNSGRGAISDGTKNEWDSSSGSRVTPALGESWAHATTTRLLLSEGNAENSDVRHCTLVKSPHKPVGTASYIVTEMGIRDTNFVCHSSSNDEINDHAAQIEAQQPLLQQPPHQQEEFCADADASKYNVDSKRPRYQ